jgi:hypothetical protein
MVRQGSVKREMPGELPQGPANTESGGLRTLLSRVNRDLEVHAPVVVGFLGGGEIKVGE